MGYSEVMARILTFAQRLTTPLLPDDYLTLINPLLAQNSFRARIVSAEPLTCDYRTLNLRTARDVPAHQAGQHIRIGVDLNAVRNWRSFSLTNPATGQPSRDLQITVKATGMGGVSDHLVHRALPGDILFIEPPTGDFTVADTNDSALVMIAGGSGITPLLSMVRTLVNISTPPDVHLIYCARRSGEFIALDELSQIAETHPWFTFTMWQSSTHGHFDGDDLEHLVPDWRKREAYVCGPAGMLTSTDARWRAADILARLHMEQFQTEVAVVDGEGGTVNFTESTRSAAGAANEPLMKVGEDAGVLMPSGCRIGICHTCVVPLKSGRVRDLRSGAVHGESGQLIQTCINAAACDVELEI